MGPAKRKTVEAMLEEAAGLLQEVRRKIENREKAEIPVPATWLRKLKEVEDGIEAFAEVKLKPGKGAVPSSWKAYKARVEGLADIQKRLSGQETNYLTMLRLVAALCLRNGWAVGIEEKTEERDVFLFLELPTGQISFRLLSKQRRRLGWIEGKPGLWDGHTVQEKEARIEAFMESVEKPQAWEEHGLPEGIPLDLS